MKLTYAVIFEQTSNSWCGSAPDVPGCISSGKTLDEMRAMMREALEFHIEDLVEQGLPVPEATMSVEDALRHQAEPIPEEVMASYLQFGEDSPSLSIVIERIEVDMPATATASAAATQA